MRRPILSLDRLEEYLATLDPEASPGIAGSPWHCPLAALAASQGFRDPVVSLDGIVSYLTDEGYRCYRTYQPDAARFARALDETGTATAREALALIAQIRAGLPTTP